MVNYTIIFALITWWCHFFKFTQNYLSVNEKFQLGVSFLSCANVSDIEKSLTGSEALWPQSDVLPRVKCRRCQDREMKYLVAYIDTFGFLHYFCVMAVFSAFFAPFGQKLRLIFQRSQSIQIPLFKTEMKEAQWTVTRQVWYCSIPFHCLQLHARRETGGRGETELNTMSIECCSPYLGYFCRMV